MKFLELNFNPIVVDGKDVNNTASFYEALNIIGISPPGKSECVYANNENELIAFTEATVRDEINRANVYKLLNFAEVEGCDVDEVEKTVWRQL